MIFHPFRILIYEWKYIIKGYHAMFILKIMLNQKYCQAWGHENIINETLNMINSYFW